MHTLSKEVISPSAAQKLSFSCMWGCSILKITDTEKSYKALSPCLVRQTDLCLPPQKCSSVHTMNKHTDMPQVNTRFQDNEMREKEQIKYSSYFCKCKHLYPCNMHSSSHKTRFREHWLTGWKNTNLLTYSVSGRKDNWCTCVTGDKTFGVDVAGQYYSMVTWSVPSKDSHSVSLDKHTTTRSCRQTVDAQNPLEASFTNHNIEISFGNILFILQGENSIKTTSHVQAK